MTSTNPASTLSVGERVQIVIAEDHWFMQCRWFPKDGATGTVERIFKNGNVAVAVDQVRNFSADGKKTLHLKASELVVVEE